MVWYVPGGGSRFDALEQAMFKGVEAGAKLAEDARPLRQEVAVARDSFASADAAVATLRAVAHAYDPSTSWTWRRSIETQQQVTVQSMLQPHRGGQHAGARDNRHVHVTMLCRVEAFEHQSVSAICEHPSVSARCRPAVHECCEAPFCVVDRRII